MPLSVLSEAEQQLFNHTDCIRSLKNGPQQFSFSGNSVQQRGSKRSLLKKSLRMFPLMRRLGKDVLSSLETVDQNPTSPKETVTQAFLEEFENHAFSLGVGVIGYTDLPHEAVFKDKAVLFDRVIVLAMEMDKGKIDAAPSAETMHMIMDTYYKLGQTVNILVDYLHKHGYAVQGGHPLGGQALYPLIGEKAGMGYLGRHGMLITQQFGSRQRLAAIYCNIKNLPSAQKGDNKEIADFCERCGRCITACPVMAIYEKPIRHESGVITHIDAGRCFDYFSNNYSCSVCVKECYFNK